MHKSDRKTSIVIQTWNNYWSMIIMLCMNNIYYKSIDSKYLYPSFTSTLTTFVIWWLQKVWSRCNDHSFKLQITVLQLIVWCVLIIYDENNWDWCWNTGKKFKYYVSSHYEMSYTIYYVVSLTRERTLSRWAETLVSLTLLIPTKRHLGANILIYLYSYFKYQ